MNDLKNQLNNLDPSDIIIFHVGGVDGYGPIEAIIDRFAEHVVVVCFEANSSEADEEVQRQYRELGVRAILMPYCVADNEGKRMFYINKHSESSGIFPPAESAKSQHVMYEGINTWGENCELDRAEEMDMVCLDHLIEQGILPKPDVISLDAQGAELRVMKGGQNCVKHDALCVVTEIEFMEIYQGQDLFCDQQRFLTERGYRLADLLNTQKWHNTPACGEGFLTVAEALYFRNVDNYESSFYQGDDDKLIYKLFKLAATAYAFRMYSYSSQITGLLLERFGEDAKKLYYQSDAFREILELHLGIEANLDHYDEDNRYFFNNRVAVNLSDNDADDISLGLQKNATAEQKVKAEKALNLLGYKKES